MTKIGREFSTSRSGTDDIWEVIYTQRAIRYWEDKPVPRYLLERVVEAGSKAPSGTNSQPWIFMGMADRQKLDRISAAIREFASNSEKLQAYFALGKKSESKTERLMLTGAKEFFLKLERAPAIIIPCLYQLSSPTDNPNSLLAGSSIYMAVQNILLSARALGLGALMTTAQDMVEPLLREITGISDNVYPAAFIPIGYPDANFGPNTRKPVAEIIRFNTWEPTQARTIGGGNKKIGGSE